MVAPGGEQTAGAGEVVGGDEAGAIGFDFAPDVDLVGNQNRGAARERLGDGDAEILLLRGQYERLGGAEGAPLRIAGEHADPMHAAGRATLCGEALELVEIGGVLARPGDDQRGRWLGGLGGQRAVSPDEQIDAFFRVDATEKEPTGSAGNLGATGVKRRELALGGIGDAGRAKGDDALTCAVAGKGFLGEQPLLLAGEENGGGVAQDTLFGEAPEEKFLGVLERVALAKPRIEHAVGEDEIGDRSSSIVDRGSWGAERAAEGGVVILPETVGDDGVVARGVFAEPREEVRRVVEARARRAEGMDGRREVGDPRRARSVEGGDLGHVADLAPSGDERVEERGGTAIGRVERRDEMENVHGRSER